MLPSLSRTLTQAAVVLKPEAAGTAEAEVERGIRQLCATKLSAFKVRGGRGGGPDGMGQNTLAIGPHAETA